MKQSCDQVSVFEATTCPSLAILGGDHPRGVRGPPTGHQQNPPLCQPGLVQTARASFPALGDPALLGGLGGPQGCPDDRPGGHSCDEGRGGH